jgi:DeoR/GlpR family transcriptional regulator of sugar metabolism
MLKKERQAYIIQQINIHNKVLSSDLSSQLDVSEDTVRRDLQELAEEGKLIKVHGGRCPNPSILPLKAILSIRSPRKKASLTKPSS